MKKMKRSGYGEADRSNVLNSGVTGYFRMLQREREGGIPVNRDSRDERYPKKLAMFRKAKEWFLPKGKSAPKMGKEAKNMRDGATTTPVEDRGVEGVVFIPHTPKGALKKEMQAWEDKFASLNNLSRVKFIEKGGTKIKDLILKSDPWANMPCGREKCHTCKIEGQEGKCRRENICYEMECLGCLDEGKRTSYIGESSRTSYERLNEHYRGHLNEEKENPLWKHSQGAHQGVKQSFKMTIVSHHRKPLERQVKEHVLITSRMEAGVVMLNSKNEWHGKGLPRIVVEGQEEKEKKDNSKNEDNTKKREKDETERPADRKRRRKGHGDITVMSTEAHAKRAESEFIYVLVMTKKDKPKQISTTETIDSNEGEPEDEETEDDEIMNVAEEDDEANVTSQDSEMKSEPDHKMMDEDEIEKEFEMIPIDMNVVELYEEMIEMRMTLERNMNVMVRKDEKNGDEKNGDEKNGDMINDDTI